MSSLRHGDAESSSLSCPFSWRTHEAFSCCWAFLFVLELLCLDPMAQRQWDPWEMKQGDQLEDSCPWAKIESKLQSRIHPAGSAVYLAHCLECSKYSPNFSSPAMRARRWVISIAGATRPIICCQSSSRSGTRDQRELRMVSSHSYWTTIWLPLLQPSWTWTELGRLGGALSLLSSHQWQVCTSWVWWPLEWPPQNYTGIIVDSILLI